MTTSTPLQPGTPCWTDLTTLNIEATKAFYGPLLGWTFGESQAQFGGYTQACRDDKAVAGINPMAEGFTRNAWTLYFATDDINKTAELITTNGGGLLAPAMEVGDLGHMLVATDPTGAAFGAWQSGTFSGAELFNETGGLVWEDLRSTDPGASRNFFQTLFNFDYLDMPMASDADYKMFALSGSDRPLGGMGDMMGITGVPSHWLVYFRVDDTPSSLAQVIGLGGTVIADTFSTPWGRMGGITDPNGGTFMIIDSERS